MPRMDYLLKMLSEDNQDVVRFISNAEYIQIGLLLKIYEALHNIENSTRGTR